ncbi:hypothetical protein [Nonomuraea sp. NPDC049684]|uniref:hypothetical protein n=1 Tax=Nonomuraea sp. NPDC049684 TaxID=3364356 RepID=UPI003797C9E8
MDIHNVRAWCQARGVALRVLSGPLSNFTDLAANDATTALVINVITSVGQFQRDIQNELTVEGIAAAEAEGRYRGRRPALDDAQRDEVRTAYQNEGISIAALARAHSVSREAHPRLPEVGQTGVPELVQIPACARLRRAVCSSSRARAWVLRFMWAAPLHRPWLPCRVCLGTAHARSDACYGPCSGRWWRSTCAARPAGPAPVARRRPGVR